MRGWVIYEKDGICIGAAIASALSNLHLTRCDTEVEDMLVCTRLIRVSRYMDYCFVILEGADEQEKGSFQRHVLSGCLRNVHLTHFSR